MDRESLDTGSLWVLPEQWESLFVLTVGGELDMMTAGQFRRQAVRALCASRGPVLLDLHDLRFIDCAGARALEWAIGMMPQGRAVEVHGRQRAVRRLFDLIGLKLERGGERGPDRSPEGRETRSAGSVPGLARQALRARACQAQVRSREAADHASAVMGRLAATYQNLAHNSCYRAQGRELDQDRFLELSEQARALSTRYRRHVTTALNREGHGHARARPLARRPGSHPRGPVSRDGSR